MILYFVLNKHKNILLYLLYKLQDFCYFWTYFLNSHFIKAAAGFENILACVPSPNMAVAFAAYWIFDLTIILFSLSKFKSIGLKSTKYPSEIIKS